MANILESADVLRRREALAGVLWQRSEHIQCICSGPMNILIFGASGFMGSHMACDIERMPVVPGDMPDGATIVAMPVKGVNVDRDDLSSESIVFRSS